MFFQSSAGVSISPSLSLSLSHTHPYTHTHTHTYTHTYTYTLSFILSVSHTKSFSLLSPLSGHLSFPHASLFQIFLAPFSGEIYFLSSLSFSLPFSLDFYLSSISFHLCRTHNIFLTLSFLLSLFLTKETENLIIPKLFFLKVDDTPTSFFFQKRKV